MLSKRKVYSAWSEWLCAALGAGAVRGAMAGLHQDLGGQVSTKYFGASVRRVEDPRLLRGNGRFVDDIKLPGLLHAALVRSPHAHARIRAVHLEAARALSGVAGVFGCDDLGAWIVLSSREYWTWSDRSADGRPCDTRLRSVPVYSIKRWADEIAKRMSVAQQRLEEQHVRARL